MVIWSYMTTSLYAMVCDLQSMKKNYQETKFMFSNFIFHINIKYKIIPCAKHNLARYQYIFFYNS